MTKWRGVLCVLAAMLAMTSPPAFAIAPPPMPDAAHQGAQEVICDNVRDCTVVIGGLKTDADAYVLVTRSGRPFAAPMARLVAAPKRSSMPRAGRVIELTIVDASGRALFRQAGRLGSAKPGADMTMALPARPFIHALAWGDRAIIRISGETAPREIRLGAWWSLDRVDIAQRRFGVQGALVTPGRRSPATMPRPPRAPVIYRAPLAPQGGLSRIPPDAVLAAHRERHCGDPAVGRLEAYRLSWGRILWIAPCQNATRPWTSPCGDPTAPYVHRLMILTDEQGRLEPGTGPVLNDGLRFDAITRTLIWGWSDNRGCGEQIEFLWDGYGFNLSRRTASFSGVRDMPVTVRTRVVDRPLP